MLDFTHRPTLPPDQLAHVTNTLARWLPREDNDATAVGGWETAEWEAAAWIVYWQNALPWLAQRVRACQVEIPPPAWQAIERIETESRTRTERMLTTCVEILAAFSAEGIEAIPFKGAVMSPLYYEDPLLRPLADLDLLIQKEDLSRGLQILKNLGFRFYSRSAEDEVYLRGERQKNVWAADNVQPVELHFTLREEYAGIGYNLATLMRQSSELRPYWQGTTAHLPSTPMMLHHVCAHATSDWLIQRGRLMQIDDVRKLCARMSAADWKTFAKEVSAYGARFVYPGLAFAQKYAGFEVPAAVTKQLRAHCPPALLNWIAHTELFDASESNPVTRSGIGFDLAKRLSRSRKDQAQFWLRSLFPRRYNLSKRYPRLVETPFWFFGYALINFDRGWHLVKKRLTANRREGKQPSAVE